MQATINEKGIMMTSKQLIAIQRAVMDATNEAWFEGLNYTAIRFIKPRALNSLEAAPEMISVRRHTRINS